MTFFWRFFEFAEDQPRLLRSAIYGGALAFGATVWRVLLLAPGGGPRAFPMALGALLLSTTGGATGGLLYGLLQPLAGWGSIGRWLRVTLGLAVYACAILFIMAPFDRTARSMLRDRSFWVVGLVLLLVYGSVGTWIWRDVGGWPHRPKIPSDIWLRDAIEADLQELRERGNPDPELARVDLVERQEPSPAYVMHLWRVVGRLGRIPAPSRQARIALKHAQRILARAKRDRDIMRTKAGSTAGHGA
jgi:hypothetical protein